VLDVLYYIVFFVEVITISTLNRNETPYFF